MPKLPTFSFVIPVYKKPPEVFHKCLNSLYDQSIKDFEVIAVFDGPDDALEAVTREFPKVKRVVLEHGGGPKARNAGLEKARGTYVFFWDADCYIRPGHAKRCLEEFEAFPELDFVYSGYDFATEGIEPFRSEPFDPYSLTCGNYISSMAPIRRLKAHFWDETLEAAQDWDYWLTAVERGLKGAFIEGSGFITDTYTLGLSSDKWSNENRDKTIRTVREKHGIKDREIGVYSLNYRERAIKIAKILGGDLLKPTGPGVALYRMIINIGYSPLSRFDGIAEDVTKIQYWLPGEIEALKDAKYQTVLETIRISKTVINYCTTQYEQNKLKELGIESEVMPLALAEEDIEKVSKELPEKFSILVATDQAYADLLKELTEDLPHIDFKFATGKVSEFSCFMSFYQFATVDNAILIAQVNGRNMISNVQAPYCGFIDPDQTWEQFKKALYEKIREVRVMPLNKEAQEFYLGESDPKKFSGTIHALLKPSLEVVA